MQAAGPALSQVLLLLLSLGGTSNDLVALIDAPAYFQSRGIEMTLDKMLELAQQTGDGKAQIQQLLAIRQLGEGFSKDKVKTTAILTPIAKGEKAQDRLGFAREYAGRALRRLARETAPPAEKGDRNLTRDLLGWLPTDPTLVWAVYLASAAEADPKVEEQVRGIFKKMTQALERSELCDFADKVGNVRADGFGFGLLPGADEPEKTRIYIHLKGKADAKRLAAVLSEWIQGGQVQEEKDAKGTPIRMVTSPNQPPACAFLGDTDLLLTGYGRGDANHLELLRQMLKVRAEGKGSVLTGHLAEELKKVSPKATALVLGPWPPDAGIVYKQLQLALPVPKRIHLEVGRSAKGVDLTLAETFENEDQAKEFTAGLAKLAKQTTEALEKLPGDKLPAETNKLLRGALGTFKADSKGKTGELRAHVPADLIKTLPDLLMRWLTLEEPTRPALQKTEQKSGAARLRLTPPPAGIPCLHETRPAA
jgi:hypothetical protein